MRGKRGELTITFLASKIAPGFSTLFLVDFQRGTKARILGWSRLHGWQAAPFGSI
jgi:hypothetical protein